MKQIELGQILPRANPDRTAIRFQGKTFSYLWLHRCVNRITNEIWMLRSRTKRSGAILLDRSPEMIAAVAALLEMEIPFVPIDPSFPKERIDVILLDAEVDFLVSQSKYKPICKGLPACYIDEPAPGEAAAAVSPNQEGTGLAYVAYTSGTSGSPKGVMVTRKGLANFIEGFPQRIHFNGYRRIACFTTVSFDIFLVESVAAVCYGGEIVLAREEEKDNPRRMANLLTGERVEILQLTPSRLQMLHHSDPQLKSLQSVKILLVGGEPFPDSLLACVQQKTKAKIYNLYGPTECTIWATVSDLTHKAHVDIGKPLPNIDVCVVDPALRPVLPGEMGELCIAGVCLAAGYHKQEDLTARSFCCLPGNGGLVYRTGDYVRELESGDLTYLGRKDNQIKLHGYRIELEEIEHNAQCHPAIARAVALVEGEKDQKTIVLTYSRFQDREIREKELRSWLKARLPAYMLPARYVEIQDYPYTPNGKMDRTALESIVKGRKAEVHDEHPPLSPLEREIGKAMESVLNWNDDKPPMEATWLELGVDSLSFIRIAVKLEETLGFEFEDHMLDYKLFGTVRELSDYVCGHLKKTKSEKKA